LNIMAKVPLLPLAVGVIFCHMASSVYHESIFKIPGYKFGW
jgi:hypothetical protein